MQKTLFLEKLYNFILDMLFPVYCPCCNKKDEILCENCLLKIKLTERETEKDIIAIFDYRDLLMKKIIWQLKYHHQKYLGQKLGQIIYEFTKNEISDIKTLSSGKPIIVIPVPSSKKRLKERGYNQAELLATGFWKENPRDLEFMNKLVFKKIETEHQARISNKKIRLNNLKGVFVVNDKFNIRGRSIVVIDDVTTTGDILRNIKSSSTSWC